MKPGVIYGIIFFITFLLVSAGMYYIADTQPELLIVKIPGSGSSEHPNDTTTVVQKSQRIELLEDQIPDEDFYSFLVDTTAKLPREKVIEVRIDTIYQDVKYQDPALLDSITIINASLTKARKDIEIRETEIKSLKSRMQFTKDSTYTAWLKKTVKICESMKPQNAAKLIQEKSDSEARDLIYAIKQKKVANILAVMDDETVKKLTRSK